MWCNVGFTQSSLPKCKGDDYKKWTNCHGINVVEGDSRYAGEWKDGLPHGQGTATGVWGEWIGEYKNGNLTQGTAIHTNGDTYVGGFDYKGLFHGQGTFTMIDGTIEKGIWQHGVLVEPN